MSDKIHVETRGLPAVLKNALEAAGYRRPTVAIERRESCHLGWGPTFTGNRSFAIAVNLATGEAGPIHRGSWGGSNMFTKTIDDDDREHAIPPNGAAIVGESGGRGAFATIYVHPSNVTLALPVAGGTVTPRQAAILAVFASIKGGYRGQYLTEGKVSGAEIDGLVSAGLLKRNRAGAIAITADGRNNAARHTPYGAEEWHLPTGADRE